MRSLIVTGIDIGHHSIKAVTVRLVDGEFTLIGCNELILTNDIFSDGHQADHPEIVIKLKELKKHLPFFCLRVAVSLPDNAVISKTVSISNELEAYERENAIYEAFSQQSMISAGSLSLDYMELTDSSEIAPDSTPFLVHASRKEIIDSYASALSLAGLNPVLIDSQAYSLLQILLATYDGPEASKKIIIDIGKTKTLLCYFTDDNKPFHKHIDFGTRELKKYDKESIHHFGEQLGSQIRMQFQLYHTANSGGSPEKICLCGGGTSIPGLPELLSGQLQVRCDLLNPFYFVKSSKIRDITSKDNARYCTAFGVAMRGALWGGGRYDSCR